MLFYIIILSVSKLWSLLKFYRTLSDSILLDILRKDFSDNVIISLKELKMCSVENID